MISSRNHTNRQFLLHLSLVEHVGPRITLTLLRHLYAEGFPDLLQCNWMDIIDHQDALDLSVLYSYTSADYMRKLNFNEKVATTLVDGLTDRFLVDRENALMATHGIRFLTLFDDEYPEILKQIYAPPLVLYVRGGSFKTSAKCMAFVGSRKASNYAVQTTNALVPDLVARGWVIVSGGAEGADTMAHEAALKAQGKTIAVLGSGILSPYPLSNIPLFGRIEQAGGIVVSTFPLLMEPDRGNFPARNRIISGLSLGCVVVQAAERSGALITAKCALEQGRQVFAIPGPINDPLSVGCHALIKEGAKLVNTVNDIMEEFGEAPAVQAAVAVANNSEERIPALFIPAQVTAPILVHLTAPLSLEELGYKTGMEMDALQDQLFNLQLEGKVRQHFTGMWERL